MAADPTLADRVLADQLDGHMPPYRIIDIGTARAAAVRLRKLDAIEEAVDVPEILNVIAAWAGERIPEHGDYLRLIADALGGTEP